MRRLLNVVMLLSLGMLPATSVAQETVSDWPPDPAEIFAPGVEIIESEAGSPVERLIDYSTADDETRMIHIAYKSNPTWKEYPYPDGIDHIAGVAERADGTFLVLLDYDPLKPTPADKAIILDPQTGTFLEPTIVCDNQIQALPGQGLWRFYLTYGSTDEEITESIYICFTETGEMHGPLPEDLDYDQDAYQHIYSPDGEWVIFIGFREKSADELDYAIYSYQISEDQLTLLGVIETSSFMNVSISHIWVSNTQGVISEYRRGTNFNGASTSYYSFDATKPYTLQFIFTGWPNVEDDPGRYVDLSSDNRFEYFTGLRPSTHSDCQLRVYDADGFRTYDLGYDCVPMGIIGEVDSCLDVIQPSRNDFYYLRIDREGDPLSTLVHLDLETDQFTDVLQAEIETIAGISPDQRYLALVVGADGELFPMNACPDRNFGSDARIYIYDKQTQNFVYFTEGTGLDYNDLRWIDENTFALYMENIMLPVRIEEENDVQYASQSSLRVVTLEPVIHINETQQRFPGGEYTLNGHYLLFGGGYNILNMYDGSIIPLIKKSIDGLYVDVEWLDGDELTVYVYRSGDVYNGWRYTIRVPTLSES